MGEEITDPQIDEIISTEGNLPDAEPETEHEQQIPEPTRKPKRSTRKIYEKKPKLPDKKRLAHCLGCGNEWIARTGNNKNPSKCTICGSRRCIWADEMDDNIKDFVKEKHEEQHEEPEKEETEIEPIGENKMEQQSLFDDVLYGEEKPMPPMPKIPIKTIAIMLGIVGIAAAVYFLVIKRKRNNRKNDTENEEEEERKYPILPGLGGL